MSSSSAVQPNDSLSLATRYSLLRGRHLALESYWTQENERKEKVIVELENRVLTLQRLLKSAQTEINLLQTKLQSQSIHKNVNKSKNNTNGSDSNNLDKNGTSVTSGKDSDVADIESEFDMNVKSVKNNNNNNNNDVTVKNVVGNDESDGMMRDGKIVGNNGINFDFKESENELIIYDKNYVNLLKYRFERECKKDELFYHFVKDMLFLNDAQNVKILARRMKMEKLNKSKQNSMATSGKSGKSSAGNASNVSLRNNSILQLRKQKIYTSDCYAIHSNLGSNGSGMKSIRLVLMRNELLVVDCFNVGYNPYNTLNNNNMNQSNKTSTRSNTSKNNSKSSNTLKNNNNNSNNNAKNKTNSSDAASNNLNMNVFGSDGLMRSEDLNVIELYTIAGIFICKNDPFSQCNSVIIASTKDLTIAAQGINPSNILNIKKSQKYKELMQKAINNLKNSKGSGGASKGNNSNNAHESSRPLITSTSADEIKYEIASKVDIYQFIIFSDSQTLIQCLTERLPSHVWYIQKQVSSPANASHFPSQLDSASLDAKLSENMSQFDHWLGLSSVLSRTQKLSSSSLMSNSMNNMNNLFELSDGSNSKLSKSQNDLNQGQSSSTPQSSIAGRIGAGLVSGITGIVMDPIRGGQTYGMKGFLRGIATGISGVATKPIMASFGSGSSSNPSNSSTNQTTPQMSQTSSQSNLNVNNNNQSLQQQQSGQEAAAMMQNQAKNNNNKTSDRSNKVQVSSMNQMNRSGNNSSKTNNNNVAKMSGMIDSIKVLNRSGTDSVATGDAMRDISREIMAVMPNTPHNNLNTTSNNNNNNNNADAMSTLSDGSSLTSSLTTNTIDSNDTLSSDNLIVANNNNNNNNGAQHNSNSPALSSMSQSPQIYHSYKQSKGFSYYRTQQRHQLFHSNSNGTNSSNTANNNNNNNTTNVVINDKDGTKGKDAIMTSLVFPSSSHAASVAVAAAKDQNGLSSANSSLSASPMKSKGKKNTNETHSKDAKNKDANAE